MATITQHHQLDAPPRTVLHALTDAEVLCNWWTTSAQSDPQIGGEFRFEFLHTKEAQAQGKTDMVQEGKYTECDAQNIQLPWAVGPAHTTVRFVLNVENGGTDLMLKHTDIPDDEATIEALTQGWAFFLGNLASVLGGGPDRRPEAGLVIGAPAQAPS